MEETRALGPVAALQGMLRTLASVHWEIPYLYPDGRFGEDTLEAVMAAQRLLGLPVTGTVDLETWEAVMAAAQAAEASLSPPRSVCLFPFGGERVRPGQSSPMLIPIQGMFQALSVFLEGIREGAESGRLDRCTEENLRWLRRCCGLPEEGDLDRDAWDMLSRLYETFVARSPRCAIQDDA